MPEEKSLSEAAQLFLREFQKLLDDFAAEEECQIAIVDKEGNLIIEIPEAQRVYKLIIATEEGRIRYRDSYKMAFSLVKAQKTAIFGDDYIGYACVWIPIMVRGSMIGMIISCGGRYDRGESKEKLRDKFSKLADELGIIDKEGFLRAAIDEVKIVTEDEVKKRAEKLIKLVEILTENVQTPLREIFG